MSIGNIDNLAPEPGNRRAWGRRRMTPGSITGSIEARSFIGLPDGVTRPFELVGALKRARAQLGIPGEVVDLVDCVFSFSEAQEWQAGSRPIVWPSNGLRANQLGITLAGLKKRVRRAFALRLISDKPSPNGKRFGVRPRGILDLDHTFGFDLSLMAVRHAEFTAAAARGRELYQATKALQRRGYAAKTALKQLIETAAEEALWTGYWETLGSRCAALFPDLAGSDQPAQLAHTVTTLEGMRLEAEAVLTRALGDRVPSVAYGVNSPPKETPEGPLYNSTNHLSKSESTCSSGFRESSRVEGSAPYPDAGIAAEVEERFSTAVVVEAAPELASYCRSAWPGWDELADSARLLCPQYEISQRLWGRACQSLGRHAATLALAVMIHQTNRNPVRSPGGYFHNMIERAKRGELDLKRSYYGMRSRLSGLDATHSSIRRQ